MPGAGPTPSNDLLIDKEKFERHYAERRENPYRILEGSFHVQKDASPALKKQHGQQKLRDFVELMGRKKWALASRDIRVFGPIEAHDISTNLVLPSQEEYRIRAMFKYRGPSLEPVVIEVPSEMIKQAPDHTLEVQSEEGLKKALKINF